MIQKALNLITGSIFLLVIACSHQQTRLIQGAGATFPAPLYTKLFADFVQQTGVQVSYQAVGSGAGIKDIVSGVVDFGASDACLNDSELKQYAKEGVEILHLPGALAAVNFTYNIPGFDIEDAPINLDADIIYGIYSGEITNWNDYKIAELNPLIELPDLAIIPVYRSDSSGTTFTMSEFLSKASSKWTDTFGTGKSINWITGIGQKGNSAMMSFTKENPGAISYVDFVYASQNNFPIAAIKNKDGNFVVGNLENTTAAVSSVVIPEDTRISLTYRDGKNSAPMATFSYLLIRKEQNYNNRTLSHAQELVKLLLWLYSPEVLDTHPELYFSEMPENMVALGKNIIKQITYNDQPVIETLSN